MSYTSWLRAQIDRLEEEIRTTSVFDTDRPASVTELRELRTKAVLRTYLKQQLLRRQTANVPLRVTTPEDEYDTQELMIVRGA